MITHIETKRQRQAYEYYYKLGSNRTHAKTAKRFNVHLRTIDDWSNWYEWKNRINRMDIETAKGIGGFPKQDMDVEKVSGAIIPMSELAEVDNQVEKDIDKIGPNDKLAIKKSYREIVKLALQAYKEKLLLGKIKVNIGDIERLMKLDFALMGDGLDRLDINITTDKATKEFEVKEGVMSEKQKDQFYGIVARYAREEKTKND